MKSDNQVRKTIKRVRFNLQNLEEANPETSSLDSHLSKYSRRNSEKEQEELKQTFEYG